MSRYIDADALGIGKADRNAFTVPEYADGWNSAIEIIENAPTADVVEVVRCKDCKHYGGVVYGGVCRKYSGYETKVCTEKDHYCSYGERKDEAIRSAIEEWNGERDKSCDTCAFYNEDRDNQPCCYCAEHSCWVKGEEDDT
jgi:hypothetical protein